jgi:hypothetical protein
MAGGTATQHQQQRREQAEQDAGKHHPPPIQPPLQRGAIARRMGKGHRLYGSDGLLALAGNQLASSRFIST